LAARSVDGVNKNKTYINKVDIYDENEGPVRTEMLEEVTNASSVCYAFPRKLAVQAKHRVKTGYQIQY
jgi:hypothetical protein